MTPYNNIKVQNLGKQYRIGQRQGPYKTIRETINDMVMAPWRRLRGGAAQSEESIIWALKDVSFDVQQGEVVGIIGRNGAGKSTLLKILSRITDPTTGSVDIYGRVGSLLEVGTGFHPELTGRENIYLNGAILGMKRAEIERKFDEIVDFAEIERFLDTAVKHYSSGMYMRLAFSVAAHLEPEILLVDEVLAVGDMQFQKKCLGKMSDVAHQGRTVLFVSHAMAAVHALCQRGIVLQSGEIIFDGEISKAIEHYTRSHASVSAVQALDHIKNRNGTGDIRIKAFWLEDESGTITNTVLNGRPCTFVIQCQVKNNQILANIAATVTVRTTFGTRVFYHHNLLTGQPFNQVSGTPEFRLHINRLTLSAGEYILDLGISTDTGHTTLDGVDGMISIEVNDGDFYNTGFEYRGGFNAVVLVDGDWHWQPASIIISES